MRVRRFGLVIIMAWIVVLASGAFAQQLEYTPTGIKHTPAGPPPKPAGGDEKPFKELIKDRVAMPGLFTFYLDTLSNSVYMAIKPSQLEKVMLMGETVSKADGAFSDNGSMAETSPIYFRRVGKKILMLEKNLRLRADSTTALSKAVPSALSDQLIASVKIESKPQDSTNAVLVDPSAFFVRDVENVGFFLNQGGATGINLDRENSYFEKIKSFPENSELDVKLAYKTNKPQNAPTLQNPYAFYHTYHYSLSMLPESDYVPRVADDRVGYFMTMYQDYSNLDRETPYVRYIDRWNLKKKDPAAALSEPVKPVVYWVENTVPEEFRADVAQGIEFWNKSFEKIGFKNAIVAKQMPDTATWDPADVRYNTVRWMIMPGGGYAVGPHRANPYTGEILDADIRVSADFIRYMFNNMEKFIAPVSFNGNMVQERKPNDVLPQNFAELCNYGSESAMEAAFGLAYLQAASGDLANKDSICQRYVHEYVVQLVSHEVGHTLGLRHNFKASTVYSLEQINDPSFTRVHSDVGTTMDYAAPNIAGKGKPQGEFYGIVPGPYDDWVIEYGYSDFGAKTSAEELPKLQAIASRAAEPLLAYATDEDAFSGSTRGVDPTANLFDLGNDPLRFSEHKIQLTRELWTNAIKEFEKPGNRYQKLLAVFTNGWRAYSETAQLAPKFVGGLYTSRDHIGDPNGRLPFRPVSAAEQRRALKLLNDYIFAPNAFDLPADLLNKLGPERMADFTGSVYSSQIDYPFQQVALNVQNQAIGRLYDPMTLGRLMNNANRVPAGGDRYTMYDMFTDVRNAIWTEALKGTSANSFRRQLQILQLNELIDIYLSSPAEYPTDARTLASNDLNIIEAAARSASTGSVDEMSKAHYREVVRQIAAAKSAQKQYN
ncbi:MAG: zinc-dependent metalloprotease [Candidatus Zixiibacteriota bacterium]